MTVRMINRSCTIKITLCMCHGEAIDFDCYDRSDYRSRCHVKQLLSSSTSACHLLLSRCFCIIPPTMFAGAHFTERDASRPCKNIALTGTTSTRRVDRILIVLIIFRFVHTRGHARGSRLNDRSLMTIEITTASIK